jgi:ketosteroid isomerase-like protein
VVSSDNKQLMREIFAELAKGNGKPFRDSMADDFRWTITGSSPWSGTWQGKQEVTDKLLRPLFARFADTYTSEARRFIAEGNYVVVECRNRVTTKTGEPYCNAYCFVCRFADGKLHELTEYMDTELAVAALGLP